jgi:hypothetical protein
LLRGIVKFDYRSKYTKLLNVEGRYSLSAEKKKGERKRT